MKFHNNGITKSLFNHYLIKWNHLDTCIRVTDWLPTSSFFRFSVIIITGMPYPSDAISGAQTRGGQADENATATAIRRISATPQE